MNKYNIVIIVFLSFNANAQTTINTPNEREWKTYLLNRIDSIQQKLYKIVIQGKAKAYMNDSLTSVYSLQSLKLRGNIETPFFVQIADDPDDGYDSVSSEPFNPKRLKGLGFLKEFSNSYFDLEEKSKLVAVSLLYEPIIGGMLFNKMPFCWISISEVESQLTVKEFEFLKMYYYFCNHGDGISKGYDSYDYINENPFDVLMTNYKREYVLGDSLQNKLIYTMLVRNDFFSSVLLQNPLLEIVFDETQKRKVSYIYLDNTYSEVREISYFDKGDSISGVYTNLILYNLKSPQKLNFSNNNQLETISFICDKSRIKSKENKKPIKDFVFTLSKEDLMRANVQPILIWFYEDYFNWLKNK